MRPAPHQTGRKVLQPRQFDLELALEAARPLGENFEHQQNSIVNGTFKFALKVALLSRAQSLVEQHLIRTQRRRDRFDLFRFARTNKQRGVRRPALAGYPFNHLITG